MSNWYEQGGSAFKPPEVVKREKRDEVKRRAKRAAKVSSVRNRFRSLQKLYGELFPEEEWSWALIEIERKMTVALLKRDNKV